MFGGTDGRNRNQRGGRYNGMAIRRRARVWVDKMQVSRKREAMICRNYRQKLNPVYAEDGRIESCVSR